MLLLSWVRKFRGNFVDIKVMDTDVRFITDPAYKNLPNDLLPACTSGRAFFSSLFSSLAVQVRF
jgi:hypothetical protein